jgi:hypothetical protein
VAITKTFTDNIAKEGHLHAHESRCDCGANSFFAVQKALVAHFTGEYIRGDAHENTAEDPTVRTP